MVSGYASDLYDQGLRGCDRVELAATTGNGVRKGRTEIIWINRDRVGALDLWGTRHFESEDAE